MTHIFCRAPPTSRVFDPPLPDSLSKTRVFERGELNRKFRGKNGLNVSQNSFLILASPKV
jgi:hypothetical protein